MSPLWWQEPATLEPSVLPYSVYIYKNLDSGAEPGIQPRQSNAGHRHHNQASTPAPEVALYSYFTTLSCHIIDTNVAHYQNQLCDYHKQIYLRYYHSTQLFLPPKQKLEQPAFQHQRSVFPFSTNFQTRNCTSTHYVSLRASFFCLTLFLKFTHGVAHSSTLFYYMNITIILIDIQVGSMSCLLTLP